jgi:Tfp pilus assembly protein PilO
MFFERVAKLPRIVNIGSMKISIVRQSDSESSQLQVDGTATTFRFLNDDADHV